EVVGIAHLDISPANIVFKQPFNFMSGKLPPSPHIRIIDFNTSKPHDRIGNSTRYIIAYRAPEVCLQLNYTAAADIWAVGGLGFFMVRGFDLFSAADDEELIYAQQKAFDPVPVRLLNQSFGPIFVRLNAFCDAFLDLNANLELNVRHRYLDSFFDLLDVDECNYFVLLRNMYEMDHLLRPTAAILLDSSPLFSRYLDPSPETTPPPHPYQYSYEWSEPERLPDWTQGPFPFHIPVSGPLPSDALPLTAPLSFFPPLNLEPKQRAAAAARPAASGVLVDAATGQPLACPYQVPYQVIDYSAMHDIPYVISP
ncbi:hypothetical protein PMAYCL1PPCAC_32216, partial [Pristionchus mayeri]